MDVTEFINDSVYFNYGLNEEYKKKVIQIFSDVCAQINNKNSDEFTRVITDIEFILIKDIEDNHSRKGGLTTKTYTEYKTDRRLFILFSPDFGLGHIETNAFALAHEFGHIFFGHPLCTDHGEEIKKEREIEASKKAAEWGFSPHAEDKMKDPYFATLIDKKD